LIKALAAIHTNSKKRSSALHCSQRGNYNRKTGILKNINVLRHISRSTVNGGKFSNTIKIPLKDGWHIKDKLLQMCLLDFWSLKKIE